MTENQRKFLTEYLGECWHEVANPVLSSPQSCIKCGEHGYENGVSTLRTFTDLKDKQDLLEKVIEKGEWMEFCYYLWATLSVETFGSSFFTWLIQLPPIETAELICKWKVKY